MNTRLRPTETFMLHFEQLRNATNDSPKRLISFFLDKPSYRVLAENVKRAADLIDTVGDRRKIHPQVPDQFAAVWKTYLYKWKKQVEYISAEAFYNDLGLTITFDEYSKQTESRSVRVHPNPDYDEDFDPSIHDGGAAIRKLIDLAKLEQEMKWQDGDDDSCCMANTWAVGVQALEFLENNIGIDMAKAFDRWNKVLPIFVPKRVANQHGIKGSLYELLNDAIRAYVAGAPAASVAMCRAALEMILRDHYLPNETTKDQSLCDVIYLAAARYDFLNEENLHKLRKSANTFLHDYASAKKMTPENEKELESFIRDIKYCIEKAPDR